MTAKSLNLSAVDRSPSLYETVSERLLAAIRDADLAPGSKIPSERELGDRFGVSRTVSRESIRHLAAKGVLEVVSGSGVVVADVGYEGVSESIDLYLRQRGPLQPSQISEVRESLELTTTRFAAERASVEQLREIRARCEAMALVLDDADEASRADVAFHRSIAEATGNPLFLVLVDSLSDVLFEIRRATLGNPKRGAVAVEAHRAVLEAIEHRDVEGAEQAMRAHLEDSREALDRSQSR